jgi:nickel-dependent lactate racemase
MPQIDLRYGRNSIAFEYDDNFFDVLQTTQESQPLTDLEIGSALDDPIDSASLEEIVMPGESVLIVVPDATRQSGCGQIVNLVVRRLLANGSTAANINIIFATGIHRPVTTDEINDLLTPFIAQRIRVLHHDASDPIKNFKIGETSSGIPVEVNWMLTEYDHVVIVGSVTFHYFAGFTGGRKLIVPGLASAKTISATHALAFDCETMDRRAGVGVARLEGNPVNEAFLECTDLIKPSFAVNTIVDGHGNITEVFCGDWKTSHRSACDKYYKRYSVGIAEKRPLVIASCGGYPLDINMIQAHKALDAATKACIDGGTIILLAECPDSLGRSDFLDWFDSDGSENLARRLCANYQVNGQTAWSLLQKTERFNVELLTDLTDEIVEKMRMKRISNFSSGSTDAINRNGKGYIMPAASKIAIELAG